MNLLIVLPILTGLVVNGQPIETEIPGDTFETSTVVIEDSQQLVTTGVLAEKPDNAKPISSTQLTHYYNDLDPVEGTYKYGFATSDGIRVEETGSRKEFIDEETGKPTFGTESSGSYSYVYDGIKITVFWKANEKGFQPKVEFTPV